MRIWVSEGASWVIRQSIFEALLLNPELPLTLQELSSLLLDFSSILLLRPCPHWCGFIFFLHMNLHWGSTFEYQQLISLQKKKEIFENTGSVMWTELKTVIYSYLFSFLAIQLGLLYKMISSCHCGVKLLTHSQILWSLWGQSWVMQSMKPLLSLMSSFKMRYTKWINLKTEMDAHKCPLLTKANGTSGLPH